MEMLSLPLRERCLGITSTCWRSGAAHGAPPRWKLWYLTHAEPGGGEAGRSLHFGWRRLEDWLIDWLIELEEGESARGGDAGADAEAGEAAEMLWLEVSESGEVGKGEGRM